MSLGLEDSAYKKLHKINQRLQSNKEEINNIQKELWTNDVKIPISQILNNQQLNNEILEIESKSLTKKQTLYSKIYELIFASTKKIEDDVVNKDKQARSIINTANGTNISIDDLLSIDNLTSEEQEILKSFNNSEQNTSDISYNKLLNNIHILPDNLIDKIEKKLEINKEKREDGVLIKYLGPLFFTIVGITLTLVGIFLTGTLTLPIIGICLTAISTGIFTGLKVGAFNNQKNNLSQINNINNRKTKLDKFASLNKERMVLMKEANQCITQCQQQKPPESIANSNQKSGKPDNEPIESHNTNNIKINGKPTIGLDTNNVANNKL